jgi:quercetin dioxygenase-like cupin family protein
MDQDRERISKEGSIFRIDEGYSWIETEGLSVHLVLTPKVGSRMLNVSSGFHKPGEGFEPHMHPISEELVIVIKGKGQFYLKDRWIDVEVGDILFAPPGIKHGTRNPATNSEEFVTVGCASPPQLDLYQRANYKIFDEM